MVALIFVKNVVKTAEIAKLGHKKHINRKILKFFPFFTDFTKFLEKMNVTMICIAKFHTDSKKEPPLFIDRSPF